MLVSKQTSFVAKFQIQTGDTLSLAVTITVQGSPP